MSHSTHPARLPHGWRHLPSADLEALLPVLGDSDADIVDAELASRPKQNAA